MTLSRILGAAALALCAAALVSCGGPAAPDDRTVVEFWHAMGGQDHQALLAEFVQEFEKRNPDVHVVPVYQGHYGALSQKLIGSVVARTNPAMAQMYEGWTSRFLSRGLMDPVQNHLDGPYGMTREELEDVWEPFRENNSWNGELVTLPFNKSGYVLCANKDMLAAAGYDHAPRTWEELREMARRLTVRSGAGGTPEVYGLLLRSQIEAYSMFLFRAGGGFLSDDFTGVVLQDAYGVETLEFLRTMVVEERTAYTDSTTYPPVPFGAGQVAMFVHTSATFPFNDQNAAGKFEWIAAPLPHPEGREGGVLFQGTNIGIFSRPHSAEVREAAWRFLKFITNTENAARWSIATGYVPVRRSSLDTPEMRTFLETHPNYRVPIDCIPEATFDPRPRYWDQMRPQIATYAIDAINGRTTAEEGVATIEEKLREIIEYEVKKN